LIFSCILQIHVLELMQMQLIVLQITLFLHQHTEESMIKKETTRYELTIGLTIVHRG